MLKNNLLQLFNSFLYIRAKLQIFNPKNTMKKLTLLLSAASLLFAVNTFAQGNSNTNCNAGSNGTVNNTCSSHILKYSGPHNCNQLEKLLNESNSEVLKKLDPATKTSLVMNMIFSSGLPTGMSETSDENIKRLGEAPEFAKAVFSAIFGCEVIVHNSDNRPTVDEISVEEYNELSRKQQTEPVISECTNCYAPGGGLGNSSHCCQVGGKGCYDLIIRIDGKLYRVK
jgi:hypothetical protein